MDFLQTALVQNQCPLSTKCLIILICTIYSYKVKAFRSLGKDEKKINCNFLVVYQIYLLLHPRDFGPISWFKPQILLRGHNSLMTQFVVDFSSFTLKLLGLYKSTKILVGFLFISHLGAP